MKYLFWSAILLVTLLNLFPVIMYLISLMKSHDRMKRWRDNLVPGMYVIVNDNAVLMEAMVVSVSEKTVRIVSKNGRFASYGKNCIYLLHQ